MPTKNHWSVQLAQNDIRTMSLQDLVVAIRSGKVTPDHWVLEPGATDWRKVRAVGAVTALLSQPVLPRAPSSSDPLLAAPAPEERPAPPPVPRMPRHLELDGGAGQPAASVRPATVPADLRFAWIPAVLAAVASAVLIWMTVTHDTRTAEGTLRTTLTALSTADLAQLRSRPELGMKERIDRDVAQYGKRELDRREAIVKGAQSVGEQLLREMKQRVEHAGERAWNALAFSQQREVWTHGSRSEWIMQSGMAALTQAERAVVSDFRVFDNPPAAGRASWKLGYDRLSPQDRADVDALPKAPDMLTAETHLAYQRELADFIEEQGKRLLTEDLRSAFRNTHVTVEAVRYRGAASRALLRTGTGVAELKLEGVFDTKRTPARAWIDDRAYFVFDLGRWKLTKFAPSTDAANLASAFGHGQAKEALDAVLALATGDPSHGEAVAGLLRSVSQRFSGGLVSPNTIVGVFQITIFWLIVKGRQGGPFARDEAIAGGAVLFAAMIQHLAEGQVNVDDWAFTPLYLAAGVVVGVLRGPKAGYVAGSLAGIALLTGAVLFHLPKPLATMVDTVPLNDYLLFLVLAGACGAAAGALRRGAWVAAALPLVWVLGCGLLQRDALASLSIYAHACLGVVVAGVTLAVFARKTAVVTA